ncbi:MAG: hypothetical protein EXR11_02030 [Rhodospirillaceae bacterium]|nr:hypothetical protein [Rhodospirillaceae bacterium]
MPLPHRLSARSIALEYEVAIRKHAVFVIPAKAGIHVRFSRFEYLERWTPACAGVTMGYLAT